MTLTKNVIVKNAAPNLDGGGIVVYAREQGKTIVSMINNLIEDNEAAFGGGLFGYAWGPNGEVAISLANNIIAGNKAWCGAAIYSCSGITDPGNSVTGGLVK